MEAGASDDPGTRATQPPDDSLIACPACQRPVVERHARFCAGCGHRFASPSIERFEERTAAADPLVGRTLADRYRIEEVIGRGGMGVVYRVEHVRIGKAMAMKLLHGDLARDRDVVRRFRREAETVSKLDHPNTVQIFDFGQAEGLTYLVMELLGGEDLGLILHTEGTLPFGRTAHIAAQVCSSVHQAHERGIVHRDLKPENIRILHDRDSPDFVKVLDFGLAKLRESNELAGASITRHGLLVGTPYYMAPEQIRGERYDHRADIYAMGCMLYKAAVGVPPFWAPTPIGVLTKHVTEDPVPPTIRSPRRDLTPDVDRIVLRAMAKDPAARHASMKELRDELDAYLRAHPEWRSGTSRRSIPPEPAHANSQAMTQPAIVARHRGAPPRTVVAATRDEVERYERQLRRQSRIRLALAGAFVLGAPGAFFVAWQRREAQPDRPLTNEREPNNQPGQENALAPNVAVEAYLGRRIDPTQGDVDVYAIEVPPGVDAVALRVTEIPNIDLVVELFAVGRSDPIVVLDAMPMGGPEAAPNLPLTAGRYLVRVHERREAGRHPTENVSDAYRISWTPTTRTDVDEREWNDTPAQAETLTLDAAGSAERRGYIGWNGDRDTYCLDDVTHPLAVEVSEVAGLDLVLTSDVDGRETTSNEGGRGEPEATLIAASRLPRRICVRISAAPGAQRADALHPYVLRFERRGIAR